MDCARAKDLLSPYYDGELNERFAEEVGQHVECCPACQAELASFEQLSATVACCGATPGPSEANWRRIAVRLNEPALPTLDVPSGDAVVLPKRFARFPAVAATILAVAATLFLIVGLRGRLDGPAADQSPQVVATVDYEDVFELFEQQPHLAMETLSRRYDGREVSADQAERMLGYRPSITEGLPSETRVVSTRVLKLPQCKCAGGKCTCGPGECNCAACLCERADGSKFLVFEQCKTQEVSFGKLPFVIARRDSRDVQLIKSREQLAVSWIEDNRRLTAIGLKDEREADSLIAVLGAHHS